MQNILRHNPLLTVLAAAITAAAVSIAAVAFALGRDGDPPKQLPTDALPPSQLTKVPPGTQVPQNLSTPLTYGQFRILPSGSVPSKCGVPGGTNDVNISESKDATAIQNLHLNPIPSYIPSGWSINEVHIERTLMTDGARRETLVAVEYTKPKQFPLTITRLMIDPSCPVELVQDEPGSNSTKTLTTVQGLKAVVTHQAKPAQVPLAVEFIQGDTLTVVQAVAIDIDDLIQITSSLAVDQK